MDGRMDGSQPPQNQPHIDPTGPLNTPNMQTRKQPPPLIDETDGDTPHWEQQLPPGTGSVTRLLRERVAALQPVTRLDGLSGGGE